MEHESHHHHHPHGTGIRWLDISLGVAAAIVSLVSLWLGLHSAHSMEKLVAANSYPYVELMRSTKSPDHRLENGDYSRRVEFSLVNNGIGPARIEWVELTYKDKPMADLTELLSACCNATENALVMNKRGGIAGTLIRPGDIVAMFTADEPPVPNPVFDALHHAMQDISHSSACYCSVFDECYLRKKGSSKPLPVEQCTPPAKPFTPYFR